LLEHRVIDNYSYKKHKERKIKENGLSIMLITLVE
jgi:hypothetical protein